MNMPMVGNSPTKPNSIPEPTRPPVVVQTPPEQGQGMDPQTMQLLMMLLSLLGMGHGQPGGMPAPAGAPLPPMAPTGPGLPAPAPNPMAAMMTGGA